MVRIKRSYRIQVCDTKIRPMASSPRILNRPTGTDQTPKYAKRPSRSSSSLCVLRRQGAAKTQAPLGGKPPSSELPFRSLDPFRALREPNRRRRDEERLSRSEQRTDNNPKNHLTGKAPYRFESVFLQRRVRSEPRSGRGPPGVRVRCSTRDPSCPRSRQCRERLGRSSRQGSALES